MEHKIIAAAYHRNGVAGAGFYVAIVESVDDDGPGRYLCIDFTGHDDEDYDYGRFAVLRVDQVSRGNIGMHPITHPDSGELIEGTGGAAYRGADYWGAELRQPIRDWVTASVKASMARWERDRDEAGQ